MVLDEGAEDAGIGLGEALIRFLDEPSLRGCGIAGDVGPGIALAAGGAVDIQLGDVDRKAERGQLGQAAVHRIEGNGDIEVGLRADGPDGHFFLLQRLDQLDELLPLGGIFQAVVIVAEDGVRIRLMGVFKGLFDKVRTDDQRPWRLTKKIRRGAIRDRLIDHVPDFDFAFVAADDRVDVLSHPFQQLLA